MATKKKKHVWLWSSIVAGTILFLAIYFLSTMQRYRVPGQSQGCISNQRNIALALLNYEAGHGHFPPAYVTDEEGNPLYSWRVLLLPYMEHADIYEKLHLNEPWNSPHNEKLLSKVEYDYIFRCSQHGRSKKNIINHVLVTGPGTIWEDGKACSMEDIYHPNRTLMLIEVPDIRVHWAEPFDLKINDIDPRFLFENGSFNTSPHIYAIATFADGHTSTIPQEEMLTALKKLSQIKQRAIEDFEY